jgi:paraquat-inducible protein A
MHATLERRAFAQTSESATLFGLSSSSRDPYIPANVLPILHTVSVGYGGNDTIFSGIVALWSGGSWRLAILVFVASILVPTLKFIVLGFLILSTY